VPGTTCGTLDEWPMSEEPIGNPKKILAEQIAGIVLASESPRRKMLLEKLNIAFQVVPSRLAELPPMGERPNSYAARMALEKAVKVGHFYPDHLVIGADTVVAIHDTILGKPKSHSEAVLMLSRLSGQVHEVWTGICVYHARSGTEIVKAVSTQVRFRELTQEEIDSYVQSGEPMDKAGAYAIQGRGKSLVRDLKGSYHNVIGLPTMELGRILEQIGVPIDSKSIDSPCD